MARNMNWALDPRQPRKGTAKASNQRTGSVEKPQVTDENTAE